MYPTVIPVGDEASNRVAGRGEELLLQYSHHPTPPTYTHSLTHFCYVYTFVPPVCSCVCCFIDWLELWLDFCFSTKPCNCSACEVLIDREHVIPMWQLPHVVWPPLLCLGLFSGECFTRWGGGIERPGDILNWYFRTVGPHAAMTLLTKRRTSISCATLCRQLQLRLHSMGVQRWEGGVNGKKILYSLLATCVVPEGRIYNIWTLYSGHMCIHAQARWPRCL